MKEKLEVPFLRFLAQRLTRSQFGQKALSQPENGLSVLKQRPGKRVYFGLALMTISCLVSLPALAFLGYLSVKVNQVMIIAVGAPVVVLLAHIMFGVGVYLAGQNYAMAILLWATKRFLQKFA